MQREGTRGREADGPRRWGRRLAAAIAIVALGLLAAGVSSASAAVPIEGIWSFNGGEVAIQPQPDGSFQGTVVEPTKFSQCFHPVGEHVWTSMKLQPDGSYWGDHQWYFATEQCIPNPTLGLTAWRVLRAADGSRILRVCFSEPTSPSQPTITAAGVSAGATFGCEDSARISELPGPPSLTVPDNSGCIAAKKLTVRLRTPKGDTFERVVVKLRSGTLVRRAKLKWKGRTVKATLKLTGLPAQKFTVRIHATTVLGHEIRRKRTYDVCTVASRQHG